MLEDCIVDDSLCWHIKIGDDVTLAPRVQILEHDANTKMHLNYTKIKNVKIGNKVFIGAGTIILLGVSIGENVILGADPVVTTNIKANSVFTGNPAHFISSKDTYLEKVKNLMNSENCFGEGYTLRANIDKEMKNEMVRITDANGVGFVI